MHHSAVLLMLSSLGAAVPVVRPLTQANAVTYPPFGFTVARASSMKPQPFGAQVGTNQIYQAFGFWGPDSTPAKVNHATAARIARDDAAQLAESQTYLTPGRYSSPEASHSDFMRVPWAAKSMPPNAKTDMAQVYVTPPYFFGAPLANSQGSIDAAQVYVNPPYFFGAPLANSQGSNGGGKLSGDKVDISPINIGMSHAAGAAIGGSQVYPWPPLEYDKIPDGLGNQNSAEVYTFPPWDFTD